MPLLADQQPGRYFYLEDLFGVAVVLTRAITFSRFGLKASVLWSGLAYRTCSLTPLRAVTRSPREPHTAELCVPL